VSDFEQLLRGRDESLASLARAARAVVLTEAPHSCELIYDACALSVAFSWSEALGDAFCHVAVYRNHVNLGFNRGTELDDPESLLRGTGKLIRHLRLNDPADLEQPELLALVSEAASHALARLGDRAPAPRRVLVR